MKKQSHDGLILVTLFCLIVATAWKAFSSPQFILVTVAITISAGIFRAWRRGIFREFLTLLRFFGSLTLGWYFSAAVGKMLGLPLALASVSGFYLTFIVLLVVSGALVNWLSKDNVEPSIPEKMLGGLLGGFEGLILAWVLVFTLSMLPGSRISAYYPQMSQYTRPVENLLMPVMPAEAAKTVQMVHSVQRISQNFKLEKVNREALHEVMAPLAEFPELIALQEDESFRKLSDERNFQAMLNHPALRKVLESEELRQRMQSIDLKQLERAIIPHIYENQAIGENQ